MPPPVRLGVVDERLPDVQQPAVVDEQHLARLKRELDTQLRAAGDLVEGVEGGPLNRVQGFAGFLVAGLDPVAQVAKDGFAPVARAPGSPVGNYRPRDGGRFAGPHAAAPFHVEWLPQYVERLWILSL